METTNVVISGKGIVSPIGIGVIDFVHSLKLGRTNFTQIELTKLEQTFSYPAALVDGFDYKGELEKLPIGEELKKRAKRLRHLSTGTMHAILSAFEAWMEADLFNAEIPPERIAIVSGGSNTQQANIHKVQERYREKLNFINPTYGFGFLDTDIIGVLSEMLGIKGEGFTVGAASASGNMAMIQGSRLLASGAYDIVLVVAPAMELSIFEYQGFTALGAMARVKEETGIQKLCNPFDEAHCGFVYGQNSGALVLESESSARQRGSKTGLQLSGYGTSMDGNRNPNPSMEGEARAMQAALNQGALSIEQIDAINTHGTASVIGDQTEVEAILSIGGSMLKANATKSLIGHGVSSAGLVEAIACLLQMENDFLHPNPNLEKPISDQINWMGKEATEANSQYVMSNSFGFGGINSSVIFQKQS